MVELARQQKHRDMERAKTDPSFLHSQADAEKLLLVPSVYDDAILHKQKLSVHNYCFINSSTKEAEAHWYCETEGGIPATEIGTRMHLQVLLWKRQAPTEGNRASHRQLPSHEVIHDAGRPPQNTPRRTDARVSEPQVRLPRPYVHARGLRTQSLREVE